MIVGIDIGTQSLKAVVVSDQLEIRGECAVGYQPQFLRPGWAEQSPLLWEQALPKAIAGALDVASVNAGDIRGLGIAGQLDGCIAVDARGLPLHPCLIWMDRRAIAELGDIDPNVVRDIGGVVLDASHPAAKIRWMMRHLDIGKSVRCFHAPVSYLVSRLTGQDVIDHATASTSMLYSLSSQSYDSKLLEMFGLSAELLPLAKPAESVAGILTDTGAELTGLPKGLPVAVGTGDDFSSALGAGVVKPGRFLNVLGTAEVTGALSCKAVVDPDGLVETHAFPGELYYVENPGWLCGGIITWFLKNFGLNDVSTLGNEAMNASPGSDGVLFLPAFSGAMAPEWIASARGVFFGLAPSHGRGTLARAVLEGTAFAMRDVLDRVVALDLNIEAIRIVGGGAKSELWCQIRADLTGLPVEVPRHADTSSIGAALLGGVAAKILPNLGQSAAALDRGMRVIDPRPDQKALYDQSYGRYRELFQALKPLFSTSS